MSTLSILDPNVAAAIASYVFEDNRYEEYCEACERENISMAEWVYNNRLRKFDTYCKENFGFHLQECSQ